MDMYNYRNRLKKTDSMKSMEDNTKEFINRTFHEAPNYKKVFLNGVKIDARIDLNDEKSFKKSIIFRPDTIIFKGDVIAVEKMHWLVVDTYDNQLQPSAYVQLCNEWLRWRNKNGETKVYPCVVKGQQISLDEGKNENRWLIMSENTVSILVQNNLDTKTIYPKQRFILNDLPYEIKGVDTISNVIQGKGYLELLAQQTLTEIADDPTEDIADNDPNGWGDWQ
ncbi:MAG TPA: hypothetical protein VD651_04170 [Nitrosarchaeum sp.]|nr:hypothetical protein [Nitrosarchaeum sp.]